MTVLFEDPSRISQGPGFSPWGTRQGIFKITYIDPWWMMSVYELLAPGSTCAMRFPG